MARSWTVARLVGHEDWAGVHRLWSDALADATPAGDVAGRQVGAERLEQVLSRPGVTTMVAEHDDDLVGLMVATSNPLSGLTDSACVTVEILYVTPARRGRGIGHLLLAKAAVLAEQTGATHVVSNVPSQSRDLNRFFARMGFASTVTRRILLPQPCAADCPARRGAAPSTRCWPADGHCGPAPVSPSLWRSCRPAPAPPDGSGHTSSRRAQVIREVQTRRPCSSLITTS
ncbi:GNAT family N-acetyltransferase [uncultured Arsenicicoccus sp.]|uniref:GNAT family N-acetyltransferase n=1 Tax=uncultured Arsenicicoccus sp. TaxID=491339 RepID=UPI002597F641|nr:GNAT family N-acetyltransferase [uncultured Arsenicicoccus sp.]